MQYLWIFDVETGSKTNILLQWNTGSKIWKGFELEKRRNVLFMGISKTRLLYFTSTEIKFIFVLSILLTQQSVFSLFCKTKMRIRLFSHNDG